MMYSTTIAYFAYATKHLLFKVVFNTDRAFYKYSGQ